VLLLRTIDRIHARFTRRQALTAFGVAATAAAACGGGTATDPTTVSAATTTTGGATSSTCTVTASETEGPYPDRTGMLGNQAFYRRDVTEGRSGLPVTLALTIVNTSAGCAALANAAVAIWQCDAEGHYSEYSQPGYNGTGQTYLRGLQTTDANGQVSFQTVYPGWYAGRATHIHVEVYVNGRSVKVTQVAFPESVTQQVYRTGVYAARGQNATTNATDNVFADGTSTEMAALTGDASSGYTAALTIAVAA
jgi:protocatechuate 3,4-dioxygenase beta subunit